MGNSLSAENPIRVLIADDSFFMRYFLRHILAEGGFEVVGEAKDGREAVELADHLKPEVIIMDYHMPHLTGAEAARAILAALSPAPAIIMLSAYTHEGAEEVLECLRAGAVDFLHKPSGELSLTIDTVSDELFKKIRTAARAQIQVYAKPSTRDRKKIRTISTGVPQWLILIGASTGGPPVVEQIVAHLHADMDAAILIVQHMPPIFTKRFAARIAEMTAFAVQEAAGDDLVATGTVFVAPGDYHMTLLNDDGRYVLKLNQEPPRGGLRPSIDVLFESVARAWDGNLIAVELTGMGNDGSHAMRSLKDNGAIVLVQSLETSVIASMPESIISQNLADAILTPDEIAAKINMLTQKTPL